MKYLLLLPFFLLHNTSYAQVHKAAVGKYELIGLVKKHDGNGDPYSIGEPNQKDINRLSAPLRGLASYYTCSIQCDCDYYDTLGNVICALTQALGLGRQGSDKQIAMLKKWFPNDQEVRSAIDNNCSVGMPGSSTYIEYQSLVFIVKRDTVTVAETWIYYSHGDIDTLTRKSKALIKDNKIAFISRR